MLERVRIVSLIMYRLALIVCLLGLASLLANIAKELPLGSNPEHGHVQAEHSPQLPVETKNVK